MAAPPQQETRGDLGSVLVVGGCGFLGHHVVRLLLRDWTTRAVAVVDLRCPAARRRPPSDRVAYHEVDMTDVDRLAAVLAAALPDVVIHTASPVPQALSTIGDDLFRRVNVDGTASVIEACRRAAVRALVYTSSASILSNNVSDLVNADESWPVVRGAAQTEYYSETKAAAEELVLAANRTAGAAGAPLLTCALRPSGIIGEGDTMVLYHMYNAYRKGQTRFQIGANENLFDFTYVENVAHAHLLAARALLETSSRLDSKAAVPPLDHERVDGEAFIVTNDQPVYFWDFARAVWAAAGSDMGAGEAWVIPKGPGMVLALAAEAAAWLTRRPPTFNRKRFVFSCMTRYYDISKARRRLGYAPLVPLDEAVRRSVKWFAAQEREKEKQAQGERAE